MVAGFRATVPNINGEPSPYGLLGGCIDVVTVDDVHQLNGTEVLPSACGPADQWFQCDATPGSPTPDNPTSKTFNRPTNCSFEPVTAYTGVTCSTFGITFEQASALALEQLRLGEQAALERFFMEQWLCANATDLTPAAGALSVAQGFGVLEGWLATNYGGTGVIHVPAPAAALISHHRLANWPDGGSPQTLMGNCVVLGAGYSANVGPADPGPGCAVAPSGEAWLYITPPMRVRRDARRLVSIDSQGVNHSTNDRYALAESTFVPEVACCMAAAVRVTIC